MRALLDFAATHPRRSYPVRYAPERRGERRNASAGSAPNWRDWSLARARLLDRHCGALMAQLGYGDEPEWRAKLAAPAGQEAELEGRRPGRVAIAGQG
ncbi:hypothetical protein [Acidimangrovimonas pyrenivorans]|uniref:Uncharacterized protein n=1 Tax=Acidimangrovimonas pyrenivorans TaxID=2030798 RepID=A0ABV7ACL0_9RHOB